MSQNTALLCPIALRTRRGIWNCVRVVKNIENHKTKGAVCTYYFLAQLEAHVCKDK